MIEVFDIDKLLKEISKSRWIDLIALMKAPWFSRRWIIQEIVLARNASVHCEGETIHWDDFSDAVSLLNEKADSLRDILGDVFTSPGPYTTQMDYLQKDKQGRVDIEGLSSSILIRTIRDICRKSDTGDIVVKRLDLEDLLYTLLPFQASEAQDDIYSLLSIARDAPMEPETHPYGITANYQRSTRDLYVAFVKRCIVQSGCLDIICRPWARPVEDTLGHKVVLPTWISQIYRAPFGILGRDQGQVTGENFVGSLQGHIKRKRYDVSRGTELCLEDTSLSESLLLPLVVEKNTHFDAPTEEVRLRSDLVFSPKTGTETNSLLGTPYGQERRPSREIPSTNGEKVKLGLKRPMRHLEMPSITGGKEYDHRLSGILKVSGFKLATITKCSRVMQDTVSGSWLNLLGWENTHFEEGLPDKLWRTLVADRGPDGGNPPHWYRRACHRCLEHPAITDKHGNMNVRPRSWRRETLITSYLRRVGSVILNRCLFQADPVEILGTQPLFGLAPGVPDCTEPGDEICILFGCTVPVILRPIISESGSKQYELKGEAYVHGEISGEAVANSEIVERLRQWFEIC